MDEKFENRLIEIVMRNGKLDESLFNYSKEEKEKFLKAADLKELADILEETEKELFYCEDTDKVKELVETSKSVETEIENTCRKILAENGVDIEKAIGVRMDERKKIELLKQQLESFGIDERTAEELGLTDLETLKTDGKNFTFVLENTAKRRKELEKNHIDYTVKDGKINISGKFTAKEGICIEDSEEAVRFLDENEMNYIRMAQGETAGKGKLFIPTSWAGGTTNSQLVSNAKKLALIAAAGLVISPSGAIILLVTLKKTGLYDKLMKDNALKKTEKKALEQGLTVFKQDGKNSRYWYMENGNLLSLNANDVRLPRWIKGVQLSPADVEKLKRGELLMLKDKKGNEFGVRIDVTKPSCIQEYYKERKNDREMKKVPTKTSPDREKLEWIARKGFQGISDIYGNKTLNLERDTFLSKYDLKNLYTDFRSKEFQLQGKQERKEEIMKELTETNGKIKEKADEAILRINKENKKGMGI